MHTPSSNPTALDPGCGCNRTLVKTGPGMQVSSARCCSAHAFALLAFYCSLAPSPNLHLTAAVTTAARVHSYNHVCHACSASPSTPPTTTRMTSRLALRPPAHRLRRRENLKLIATKGNDLLASIRIAADSYIARTIYGLLAIGTHFSTQTTWMVPWLSYA